MPWDVGRLSVAEYEAFLMGAHQLRASREIAQAHQDTRTGQSAGAGRRSLPFIVHGPREG